MKFIFKLKSEDLQYLSKETAKMKVWTKSRTNFSDIYLKVFLQRYSKSKYNDIHTDDLSEQTNYYDDISNAFH